MPARPRPLQRRLRRVLELLRQESTSIRLGVIANVVGTGGDLVAGLVLAAIAGRLEEIPGLMVLIPAAIGMRGNIFGAFGSRLGTAIKTGQFSRRIARDSVLGQNVFAATVLSIVVSCALAPIARLVSLAFGATSVGTLELAVISVVGGLISSAILLVVTMGVAAIAARRDWELDLVSAPIVTAAGDMVTLPSLVLASLLLDIPYFTQALGAALIVLSVVALVVGVSRSPRTARRIIFESMPVVLIAATISSVAGLTVEKRLDDFAALPALLIVFPDFLASSGSLGSMLSARIASKLHTGLISPRALPAEAVGDLLVLYIIAVPVYIFGGVAAHFASFLVGAASPGLLPMAQIVLVAGLIVMTAAILVAYYGAVGTFRWGLDPDNHGVPLVTASMDLMAAFCLVLTVVTLGYVG